MSVVITLEDPYPDVFYTPVSSPTQFATFFDSSCDTIDLTIKNPAAITSQFVSRSITPLSSDNESGISGISPVREVTPLNISSESSSDDEVISDNVVAFTASLLEKKAIPQVVVSPFRLLVNPTILKVCTDLDLMLKNKSTSIIEITCWMNKLVHTIALTGFSTTDRFLEIGSKISDFIRANQEKVANLDFKNFSSIIAAFDKLGYRDEALFVEVFGKSIIRTKKEDFFTINFQDIANILHAFASLNILNEGVFKKLSEVILSKLKSTNFAERQMVENAPYHNISTILWAYACYKSAKDEDQYKTVVTSLIDRYKDKEFMPPRADLIRVIQAKIAYDLPIKPKDIALYREEKKQIEGLQNRSEREIQHLANQRFGMQLNRDALLDSSHHIPDLLDLTKKVVIEFDGPTHFIKNRDGINHINGSTQLRDFMIRTKDKVQLVSIPWFEWSSLKDDSEKIGYLEGRLTKK